MVVMMREARLCVWWPDRLVRVDDAVAVLADDAVRVGHVEDE